jgi:hypothetical protein
MPICESSSLFHRLLDEIVTPDVFTAAHRRIVSDSHPAGKPQTRQRTSDGTHRRGARCYPRRRNKPTPASAVATSASVPGSGTFSTRTTLSSSSARAVP